MDNDEFRVAAHALIEQVIQYREALRRGDLPVQSAMVPGQIARALPRQAPEQAEALPAILHDIDALVIPGLMNWQHPRFFGYFPSGGGYASVLGDLLSTGLGVVGLNWQASPALTEIETVTVDWMRELLGLSGAWQGVIQDTASTATLVALLCARERSTGYSAAQGGLQGAPAALTIYTSTEAHSSVPKAAALAGFGLAHVRRIATDRNFALRPEALAERIAADRAQGLLPCAIVATIGTTPTTAIDPLEPVAALAREHGLWLHVDGALGGAAMIAPEFRPLWAGVEHADSVVVNAHKWLGVAMDCSLYYVRDVQHLVRVMSTSPSYLRTEIDAEVTNYRDWGIPLGRRFRALKLWLTLRTGGAEALRARIRRDCASAQWLAGQVDAAPGWRRLAPVTFQTVCIRHEPPALAGEALDQHTLAWCRRVNDSGYAYLTPALVGGQWLVRVSIGAELTVREDVADLWTRIQEAVLSR